MGGISLSLVGHSPQKASVSVHIVNTLLFYLGIKGNFCFLGFPNLLVGSIYHVKNEGCLLEVFIMMLFNQTLSLLLFFIIFESRISSLNKISKSE